jgi:hypothetical protein
MPEPGRIRLSLFFRKKREETSDCYDNTLPLNSQLEIYRCLAEWELPPQKKGMAGLSHSVHCHFSHHFSRAATRGVRRVRL